MGLEFAASGPCKMYGQGMFVKRVKPLFGWKTIRACLLIQKKVVFVSQIKVWSCNWACKMPGASPSSPGSCNALIHQNQSHFHELVIRFLTASGQIMYFFLRADTSPLVSEANAADWLVNRPGCFWYGAGWQQINSYFVGFCLITCKNTPNSVMKGLVAFQYWWQTDEFSKAESAIAI